MTPSQVAERDINRSPGIGSDCPVCGTRPHRLHREWLFRCPGCGLLSSTLEPRIPKDRTATALNEVARLRGLNAARRISNHLILEQLGHDLGPQRRHILDVGCGHGLFLKDAVSFEFQAEGIEPDGNVVEQAQASAGVPVRQGYFPDALARDDLYDAIVFNDVLEHIPGVEGSVTAAYRHLRPGGVLVLNCPDQSGIFYRTATLLDKLGISGPFLRMWQYGLPSPHVWYFRAEHLSRLGQKAGFDLVRVEQLKPITFAGLGARISYVEGQSRLLNAVTMVAAAAMLPFLSVLPKDTSIVFLRKPAQ